MIFPFSGVHFPIPELLFPFIEASFVGETVALGIMLVVPWVPTARVWLNVLA